MDSPNNFMGSEAFLKWTLDRIVDCRGKPDTLTSLDSVYWLCVEGMLDVVSFLDSSRLRIALTVAVCPHLLSTGPCQLARRAAVTRPIATMWNYCSKNTTLRFTTLLARPNIILEPISISDAKSSHGMTGTNYIGYAGFAR